jgi:hypothetical protein
VAEPAAHPEPVTEPGPADWPRRDPGPLELRIWHATPYLEPVPGHVLGIAGLYGEAGEAGAIRGRVEDGAPHVCLLCGQPARAALIARPRVGGVEQRPVWVDLCHRCFSALAAETASSLRDSRYAIRVITLRGEPSRGITGRPPPL